MYIVCVFIHVLTFQIPIKYQDKKRNLNSRCACRNWERLFPAQCALKILLVALGHGSWVGVHLLCTFIVVYIPQIGLSYTVSIPSYITWIYKLL